MGSALFPVECKKIYEELSGLRMTYCRENEGDFLLRRVRQTVKRLREMLPDDPELADGFSVTAVRGLSAFVAELAAVYHLDNSEPLPIPAPFFDHLAAKLDWHIREFRPHDSDLLDGDGDGAGRKAVATPTAPATAAADEPQPNVVEEQPAASQVPQSSNGEVGGQADSKADRAKNSLPENPDVLRLAKLLRKRQNATRPKKEVALEMTAGDEKKADNLLRQLRRFPDLCPKRTKRTGSGQEH